MKRAVTLPLGISLGFLAFPKACKAAGPKAKAFDYGSYAEVLRTYVNQQGMVNYKGLIEGKEKLEAFVSALGRIEAARHKGWSEDERIAFWINAYNALVLKTIVDHYPIKPSLFKLAVFPRHSIQHISGVWDNIKYPVMGRPMSLEDIEHETLRKDFSEPRIHMALVCASIGCPPLRNEPYVGGRLDAQLEDQTRRFISQPQNFRITPTQKRVYLSSIFKWFGKDFLKAYGTDDTFDGHNEKVRAVLNFVSRHIGPEAQNYLATQTYSVHYTDYDWSLNEQRENSSEQGR